MSDRAVYKSTAVEFLDEMFGGSPEELASNFAYARGLLSSAEPLTQSTEQLTAAGRLDPAAGDARGFEELWLSPGESNPLTGIVAGVEVERIMRHGYDKAIEIASSQNPPKPVETFWTTGCGTGLEIHICEGKRSIILMMFLPFVRTVAVPGVGERPYGSIRASSRSWVVRVGEAGDSEVTTLDPGDPPIVMAQMSGKDFRSS
jgi:hypothetical protein